MDLKNIKTTGTFLEWVESIECEIRKCLRTEDSEGLCLFVISEYVNMAADHLPADPGRKIIICDIDAEQIAHIIITELQFMKIQTGRKKSNKLIKTELTRVCYSIERHQKLGAVVIERLSPPKKKVAPKKKFEKPSATEKPENG